MFIFSVHMETRYALKWLSFSFFYNICRYLTLKQTQDKSNLLQVSAVIILDALN